MKNVAAFLLVKENNIEGMNNLIPLLKYNSDLYIKSVLIKIKQGKNKIEDIINKSKCHKLKYLFEHYYHDD